MWRLKTEAEFAKEGWRLLGGGSLYSPDGTTNITRDMRARGIDIPYDVIQMIVHHKQYRYLNCMWTASMFIEDAPQALLCQCRWNRHPLYCSCAGKNPLDPIANIDQVIAMGARTIEPLRLDPLDLEDEEEPEEEDTYDEDFEDYEDEDEEEDDDEEDEDV